MTRTLWWEDDQLKMIDQRLLPQQHRVVGYRNYMEVAEAITDMVVRGAPAIGAAGAFGMALAAQSSSAHEREGLLRDLGRAKAVLDGARPTAVNLTWATSRIMSAVAAGVSLSVEEMRRAVLEEAQRIADEDVEVNRRMGAFGASVVPQRADILTHCNAGALATVDYGTALGVIRAAVEAGKQVHVWVDETRPRLQGARLTAWELLRDDIPMTLIADSASGVLLRTGRVDLVVFGADRVAANGDVANKIGTYKLAVVARENGVPCYAVVPTSTIDLTLEHGDLIPIEERGWEEVAMVGQEQVAPDDAPVYNPAFDVTPHRYLTGIITEEGICYPPYAVRLAAAVAAAARRRQSGAA